MSLMNGGATSPQNTPGIVAEFENSVIGDVFSNNHSGGGAAVFIPEVEQIISQLERGTVVTKFFFRKRPERRTLSIRRETRQLTWQRSLSAGRNVCEGSVDLREVKEVRLGKNSKDFEKWPDDAKKHDNNKCFVIFYGTEFRLKTLSVAALSEKECDLWIKGLNFLYNDTIQNVPYPLQLDIWLRKEFYGMENNRGNITLKDLKLFLPKINCKMSTAKLRELFQSIDTQKKGQLGFDDFSILFHQLLHQQEILNEFLGNYSADTEKVTMKEFQEFLEQEQKETMSSDDVSKLLREYLLDPVRDVQEPYLTTVEFIDFLFSDKNEIWNSKYSEVTDDMTRPLSHYWIASSHNTYLTGDQFSSESSVDAYARCLMDGCRCIELDTWDGPDGLPFIFHGHTLTTKIKFIDVLKCIKEHAFLTSEYPVILSVEDHCTLVQQRKMAEKFKEVLGDMLVTQYLDKNETQLPSPQQLKRRIILKHKKLPDGVDEGSFISNNDDFSKDMDLSNTKKNGILYIEDAESQTWNPHFFVLTQSKLLYTEMTSQPEQTDEVEDEDEGAVDDKGDTSENPTDRREELHFSEKWFHGRLRGGRMAGNELIEKYRHLGDGTFLVRESDTFVGDYTLSFWRRGRVNHCHIHSKYEWGQVKYYLVDSLTFDSLYSLITHYRSNPIRGLEFHAKLSEPVPQPQSHEGCPWYHGLIDRAQAEDKLRRIPHNGAFLVRLAQHGDSRFAISFRAEKRIKHCTIKEDGRLFTVGFNKFETLVELVNFYEKHPFYNRTSLKFPVTDELIQRIGINPNDDENIYSHPDYLDTNVFNRTTLRCRALYDYTARREDELTFTKNTIITNVLQEHPDWWVGDTDDQKQGWFPVNHVQVLEPSQDNDDVEEAVDLTPLGNLQKGAIEMMGAYVEMSLNDVDSALPYILKIYVDSASFAVGVRSDQEAKEWFEAIKETAQSASDRENQNKKMERINRIAKELSCLIIYCCSVNKFSMDRIRTKGRIFYEMYSFPETAAEKFMCQIESKFFMWYHQVQFSRVYPKGQRLDSSNYNPVPLWNAGCQMVALNYQTPDKSMQLNEGKFRQNGKCGYILRPEFMFADNFDPMSKNCLASIEPIILCINVIGARHLSKSGRGIVSPFVEIEVSGSDFEGTCTTNKTKTIQDNGFNPVWNELMEFEVQIPQLAMIHFVVQDEDMFGDPNFIGQASYPVQCLRQGYRSVPLKNGFSEDLELASLLVHLSIKSSREEVEEIIRLRDLLPVLSKEIIKNEEVGDKAGADNSRSEFQKTQDKLISLIEGKRFRNRSRSLGMNSLLAGISSSAGNVPIIPTPSIQPRRVVNTAHSSP